MLVNYNVEISNSELEKFNWGAFLFNIIWAAANGALKTVFPYFLLIVIFIALGFSVYGIGYSLCGQLIGVIPTLLIMLYIGKRGNEWAWYGSRKWENTNKYIEIQKLWGFFSPLGLIILYLISLLMCVVIKSVFIIPYFNVKINMLSKNAEAVNKKCVEKIVSNSHLDINSTTEDVVNYLVSSGAYKSASPDSVMAESNDPYYTVIKVYKNGKCTLGWKNCYLTYILKKPENFNNFDSMGSSNYEKVIMKTYFDSNGASSSVKVK